MKSTMKYDIVKIDFPFTSNSNSGKGVDRYCYMLSEGLKSFGVNYFNVEGNSSTSYFSSHYKSFPWKMKEVRSLNGKIFHATTPFAWMVPYLTFKNNILTTIHDIVPFFSVRNQFKVKESISRNILILQIIGSLYGSDIIITPFNFTKEWLQNHFNIDNSKIEVVSYGIDLPIKTNNLLNSKQGLSFKHNFLFLGSLNPIDRGVIYALNAFKLFSINIEEEYLVISMKFGTQQYMETVKIIKSLGLGNRIKIIDFVPENNLMDFLSKFRALLYPSRIGFSLLLMQSLAAGTPVIASNTFDIPDFLRDSGIHPIKLDYNAFYEEMMKLFLDSYLYDRIEKGFNHIKKFSSETMCKRTIEIYNKLL